MPRRAFVVMPFTAAFDRFYRETIAPALREYDVSRADTQFDERGILEKIVTGLNDADLIIADITGANANVMYELGIAHALGKPTIMIAQSVTGLPFDIRAYPVHEYSLDTPQDFAAHLYALSAAHTTGLLRFGNPVADFLSHVAIQGSAPQQPTAQRTEDDVAKQILTRAHEIEAATADVGAFFRDFQRVTDEYTAGIRRHGHADLRPRFS